MCGAECAGRQLSEYRVPRQHRHTRGAECAGQGRVPPVHVWASQCISRQQSAHAVWMRRGRARVARVGRPRRFDISCVLGQPCTGRVRWQRVPCGRLDVLMSRVGGTGGVLGRACAALSALLLSAPRLQPARALVLPVAVAPGAVAQAGAAALWPLLVADVGPSAATGRSAALGSGRLRPPPSPPPASSPLAAPSIVASLPPPLSGRSAALCGGRLWSLPLPLPSGTSLAAPPAVAPPPPLRCLSLAPPAGSRASRCA